MNDVGLVELQKFFSGIDFPVGKLHLLGERLVGDGQGHLNLQKGKRFPYSAVRGYSTVISKHVDRYLII